jgi:tripartite-type tricarboxylate transporter receptor subunit TctC
MNFLTNLTVALASTICFSVLSMAPSAHAQSPAWPTKPVRWIVPFAAGGAADAIARTLGTKLSEKWGQQVVVDNKPGANTVIGAVEAAHAAPDGYTLFQAINSTLTLNPYMYTRLAYDPMKDFTHIATIAIVPVVFVSNDALPAKTIPELIALAKAKPNTITIGFGNVATQLAIERFSRDAGIQLSPVPYKTGVDITKGLLSGEIQMGVDGAVQYQPLHKAGKVRILATNNTRRISSLPDVPTFIEMGFKNSEAGLWHGVSAPTGLSKEIKDRIEADLKAVLAMPDVIERMGVLGLEPAWANSADYVKAIHAESAAMQPLVKALGLKLD